MNSGSRRMPNLAAANAGLAAFALMLLLSASPRALAQAGLNIPGTSAPPPVVSVAPAPAESPAAAAAPAEMPASQMPMAEAPVAPAPQAPPMPPVNPQAALGHQPKAAAAPPAITQKQVPAEVRQTDHRLSTAQDAATKAMNSMSPEGLPSADPSGIGDELDKYNVQQRKVRALSLMNKEAEETLKLYKTLNGIASEAGVATPGQAGGGRQAAPQISEEEVRKRVEQARADALREADERKVQKERDELALGPRPVVAQIIGTAKKRQAVIMLPCDRGNVTVSVGNRLTQGDDPMRVISISEQGVEVSQKGNRFMLGFGNVSSKCSPLGNLTQHQAPSAQSGAYQVPVMGGPLQISNGARMR